MKTFYIDIVVTLKQFFQNTKTKLQNAYFGAKHWPRENQVTFVHKSFLVFWDDNIVHVSRSGQHTF